MPPPLPRDAPPGLAQGVIAPSPLPTIGSAGGLAEILTASLAGMRRNFLPGAVLWFVGVLLIATYYGLPAARPVYEYMAQWKASGGFAFSAASSSLCGGVIPFLVLWALGRIPPGRHLGTAGFLIGFWAVRGVEIDGLYRLQGLVFGTGTDVWTVVKKVAVDQFVYSLLWSAPFSLLAYRWKDADFDLGILRCVRNRRFWLGEIPVVVISLWGVWVPAVAIIYALPADLQIPLFSIVLCFWVLLLETLAAAPTSPGAMPGQAV
jgi:hypothetical protein